jgi:hypothetical protein
MEQKMSAFHCMLHLSLSRENFEKKVAYIKETAGLNGYTKTTIDGLMSKHLFKLKIKEVTTLSPISKEVTKRAGLTFHSGPSRKIFQHHVKAPHPDGSKASGKLSQVLGSPKDLVDERAKSGIYEIQCQTCPAGNYGQEHISIVRTGAEVKSCVDTC